MTLPRAALAALMTLTLVGLSGAAADADPAPRATSAALTAAPDAGSYLALVDHGPRGAQGVRTRRQSLELVRADGRVETVLERTVSGPYGAVELADWSPDGRTALLLRTRRQGSTAYAVDLASGATRSVRLGDDADVVLDPDGSGLVTTEFARSGHQGTFDLEKVAWDGTVTRLGRSDGGLLPGPDHTVLTTGALGRSIRVVSLDTGDQVAKAQLGGYCALARWYDATRVLLTCTHGLQLLDPATGATTQLTRTPSAAYSHLDAREVGGRLYVGVLYGCDTTYLAQKTGHGLRRVRVPGLEENLDLVGATPSSLTVVARGGCDGERAASSLDRFDPASGQVTPLVTLGRRAAFRDVREYGDALAG